LRIKKVVFGGTPHYGAPKSMSAFADSLYLYFDPAGIYAKLFGYVDREFLAGPINDYGATFPSAYQLLPVTSAACFPRTNELPIAVQESNNAVFTNLDIFDVATWVRYNWPKKLHTSYDRARFLSETLGTHLVAAKDFLCDLVDFDVDKQFDVTRIYGDRHRTICKLIVESSSRSRSPKVSSSVCTERGDGTVPAWVAGEFGRADAKTRVLRITGRCSPRMSSKSFSRAIRKDCTASGSKGLWGSSERTGSLICMQKLNMLFPLLPTKPTAPQLKPHGGPSRNWASRLGLFIDLQKAPDAAPAVLTVCTFMPISRQAIRRPILGRSTTLPIFI